jgi:hypothetical protein
MWPSVILHHTLNKCSILKAPSQLKVSSFDAFVNILFIYNQEKLIVIVVFKNKDWWMTTAHLSFLLKQASLENQPLKVRAFLFTV